MFFALINYLTLHAFRVGGFPFVWAGLTIQDETAALRYPAGDRRWGR